MITVNISLLSKTKLKVSTAEFYLDISIVLTLESVLLNLCLIFPSYLLLSYSKLPLLFFHLLCNYVRYRSKSLSTGMGSAWRSLEWRPARALGRSAHKSDDGDIVEGSLAREAQCQGVAVLAVKYLNIKPQHKTASSSWGGFRDPPNQGGTQTQVSRARRFAETRSNSAVNCPKEEGGNNAKVTCLSQIYHCTVESIHCLLESTIPLGVATRKHNDYRSKFSFLHVHL